MFTGDISNLPPHPRIAFHIVSLGKWGLLTCLEDQPVTIYQEGMEFNPRTRDGRPQGAIVFKVAKVAMYIYPFPQLLVLSNPVGDVHRLALESPCFGWERSEKKDYRDAINSILKK